MDIAWGIEVLVFSGEVAKCRSDLSVIQWKEATDSEQSSEDSNSAKENAAKPKKDFCQGPEPMGGMEVQVANLNRTTKTKRRGKGRTDALKDVMGAEESFKHEWNFLYKKKWREDWRHYGSFSLVVREMGACALWKKKKGRLRIIRSKDGAPIVRRA